ncbi:MAG TPA: response regulator [Pseudobdellovibrionaceae bacterium]|jgi:CheY-like chemotaxis protein|nr:response regulator [Pseudobdellovibrionaceae bacterium]
MISGKKILIADDSDDNRMLLEMFLKGEEVELTLTENGLEALNAFKLSPYHLVILDAQMPEMDGFEAAIKMREFEKATGRASVPLIALTGHTEPEIIEKIHQSGFSQHVSKPIRKNDFVNLVRDILTKK